MAQFCVNRISCFLGLFGDDLSWCVLCMIMKARDWRFFGASVGRILLLALDIFVYFGVLTNLVGMVQQGAHLEL